jgi:plastocyanin domain-containing protein
MDLPKLIAAPLAAAFLLVSPPARAHEHAAGEPSHAGASARAAKDGKGAQVVELAVTKDGFVPSTVTVRRGKPVKLVVTRKVERTCATEIVSKDLGVNRALPLDKAVTIEVAPKKAGEYRFACPMDMIGGTLRVE